MPAIDPFALVDAAAAAALAHSQVGRPRIGLVLGSGLGDYAARLAEATAVPYADLPNFPRVGVAGHAGRLWLGRVGSVPVAVLQGRVHLYEGYSAAESVFPVRTLAALGAKIVCLTNAAGGVRSDLVPGDLLRITDHLNLTGQNPLVGLNSDSRGPRFLDLSAAYDPALGRCLDLAAAAAGFALQQGVYLQLLGPSYETPAEIRMARLLGADAVGMSTVHETIALRHLGVRVAAVSCITNLAAGLQGPLSHGEVAAAASRVGPRFAALLDGFIARAEAAA